MGIQNNMTPAQAETCFQAWRDGEKKEEEVHRKRTESIDIVVGTHGGCGGEIHYKSSFKFIGDIRNIRIGGPPPPLTEIKECSCSTCGALFSENFKLYRDQVIAYRNRTTE